MSTPPVNNGSNQIIDNMIATVDVHRSETGDNQQTGHFNNTSCSVLENGSTTNIPRATPISSSDAESIDSINVVEVSAVSRLNVTTNTEEEKTLTIKDIVEKLARLNITAATKFNVLTAIECVIGMDLYEVAKNAKTTSNKKQLL